MKNSIKPGIALCFVVAGALATASGATQGTIDSTDLNRTSAELQIDQARKAVSANPGDARGYNSLASAFLQRAQETLDDRFYDQAREALKKSFALAPGDFETSKLEVAVLLGEHDFTAALAKAQALNRKVLDDIAVYGLLADAYAAIGDYKNAEVQAQWMLNMRPGNLPAYIHAAQLREIFGEFNGSYDAFDLAYQGTSPTETSSRAALLMQMARERRLAGSNEAAEKLVKQALGIFPGYRPALQELANLYEAEHRYSDALPLRQTLKQALPTAANSYALAKTLELSGSADAAASEFAEFLKEALPESVHKKNANLDLVFYYADHAYQLIKALDVASQEYGLRKDIYTLDAYAWALHVNGKDSDARKQIDAALAVGTKDPAILAHASKISVSK